MKKSILFLTLGLLLTLGAQAGDKKVYYSYDASTHTLTYYYDDQYGSHSPEWGLYFPDDYSPSSWEGYNNQVINVVIDASMQNAPLTTFDHLFYSSNPLSNVTNITGLENLNTANVTNMSRMFMGCESLTSIDLSSFNTSNVADMGAMFARCKGLTSLDLSSFKTSKVTDMSSMFQQCESLTSIDISHFDINKVTSFQSLFEGCTQLKTIYCDNDWSGTSAVTYNMFYNCLALKGDHGTLYSYVHTKAEYARPDGGTASPGYFTRTTSEPEPEPEPEPTACQTPTNVRILEVTPSTATIVFTPGSEDQTRWAVVPGIPNSFALQTQYIYDTLYVVRDLTAGTDYILSVQARCGESGDDNNSQWTEAITFHTPEVNASACAAPYNIKVEGDIKMHEVTLSWTPASEEQTKWMVLCQRSAHVPYTPEDIYMETTAPTVTITGLYKNNDYTVYVRGKCGDDLWSPYSSAFSFRTASVDPEPEACLAPTNVQLVATSNSLTATWTPGSEDQTKWQAWLQRNGEDIQYLNNIEGTPTWSVYQAFIRSGDVWSIRVRAVCGEGVLSEYVSSETVTIPEPEDPNEALDNAQADKVSCTKILRDGQLLILRGDKTFNAVGVELK